MEPKQISPRERMRRVVWVFHRLALVNLICFFVFLPVMTWFYLVLNTYINHADLRGMIDILPGLAFYAGLLLQLPPVFFYALLLLSAVLFGPFLMGLHYVAGTMIQGEQVWISDLLHHAHLNAKQGVLMGIFCVILTHLLLWNIFGGMYSYVTWISVVFLISRWVSVGILFFLLMVLPYFCQIAPSISQPIRVITKNAGILARVHLWRGLLLLFGLFVFWWGLLSLFPLIGLLGLPLLSIGLTVLAQTAVCRPLVERYVLEPARERLDS